jgi:hypothetical protein
MSAALLRALYGERHTAKRAAKDAGVSPSTAKSWLAGGVPAARLDALFERWTSQLEARLLELAAAEAELARMRMARRRRR